MLDEDETLELTIMRSSCKTVCILAVLFAILWWAPLTANERLDACSIFMLMTIHKSDVILKIDRTWKIVLVYAIMVVVLMVRV
ncbi:MAG: hypothetical protein ACRC0G_07265 [Fusobacteriaceae bacterium]